VLIRAPLIRAPLIRAAMACCNDRSVRRILTLVVGLTLLVLGGLTLTVGTAAAEAPFRARSGP